MLDPRINDVLGAIAASVPPEGMTTRIVAIDGHGGSGKTTLAQLLSHLLDAPVVHTDDFASWENPVDWWPELVDRVLAPLARGETASYVPTTWGGPERPAIVVEPSELLLLEGVTASRETFRPYLSYAIWVETPRDVCLRRGLERDGADALDDWTRWLAGEDRYIEREQPAARADAVLPGDAGLWS